MNDMDGVKHDDGKARWHLLPWRQVGEVVDVLTKGAVKYQDYNWQRVADPEERYFSAAMRHITAWANAHEDRAVDKETGCSHLAHAVCCLLFLMWFDDGGGDQ